jgi:uridine kinase
VPEVGRCGQCGTAAFGEKERETFPGFDPSELASAIELRLSERRKRPLLVALDGRSGTGKSSLADDLANLFDALVIRGDDFYSGGTHEEWAQRTPEQKADQCVDWRRLRREVLEPLLAGRTARWRTHNWVTGRGLSDETSEEAPTRVIILDGAYSARPELSDLIDISVLVRADDQTRRSRLRGREGESAMEGWHPVWDEAETYYFTRVMKPADFDLVVDAE